MASTVQIIANALYDTGCRFAFGIPGGEVLSMMDALQASGIEFNLCKHENAGGYMAEGAHHATGAPGILLATIGPGLVNAVNSVVNAWQDQVPLIIISGCVDASETHIYTHQAFDQAQLMRPVTKGTFTVTEKTASVVIGKAIALALSDPQGPVHIDIPVSVGGLAQPENPRFTTPVPAPTVPAQTGEFEAARQRLVHAKRPLMIAGVGAMHHAAQEVIREVCEQFNMPLVTTYKAKGILDENHPLAMGGHGLSPKSDEVILPLIEEADLVILAGYDPIEMRHGWYDPFEPEKAIEFTHLANQHGMHGASVSYVGNVREGLRALIRDLGPSSATWENGEYGKARKKLDQLFAERDDWGPHQVFAAARRASPANTFVTADSGAHRILLSQMWRCPHPRGLLQSTALCTMGVSLPLAIGHRLANPQQPVLSIMGDAGLEMVMGELATLRDLKLPVAVLVLVDRSLALIELKQRRSQFNNLGVEFGATNFTALADVLGGVGRDISDAATLESELKAAYQRDTFTLLACHIDKRAYDDAF